MQAENCTENIKSKSEKANAIQKYISIATNTYLNSECFQFAKESKESLDRNKTDKSEMEVSNIILKMRAENCAVNYYPSHMHKEIKKQFMDLFK